MTRRDPKMPLLSARTSWGSGPVHHDDPGTGDASAHDRAGMGRTADTEFTKLLQQHSAFRSISELGRALGEPDLPGRLRTARQKGQLPEGKLLRSIAGQLDPEGVSQLVITLAWDGSLPGFDSEHGITVQRRINESVRALSYRERRMLLDLLKIDDLQPTDW